MTQNIINGFSGEYRFLSLSYPLDKPVVEKVGRAKFRYPTIRKAYHAHRTNDLTLKARIIGLPSSVDVSALIDVDKEREDWHLIRERVLYRLMKQKFSNPGLKQRLLATGDAVLIHVDKEDLYWGKNYAGKGENRLGVLLMQLRDEYRSNKSSPAA